MRVTVTGKVPTFISPEAFDFLLVERFRLAPILRKLHQWVLAFGERCSLPLWAIELDLQRADGREDLWLVLRLAIDGETALKAWDALNEELREFQEKALRGNQRLRMERWITLMVLPMALQKFTHEYYARLPEGKPYQLIGGELVLSPAPTPYHQRVVLRLSRLLMGYVEAHQLGEVYVSPIDVVLTPENTYQPDIIFVSRGRTPIITEKDIQGAPDLVVEVLSLSTRQRDLGDKRSLYARHGVKEYWVVDPDAKTIEVLTLHGHDFKSQSTYSQRDSLSSAFFPGLSIPLLEVF